MATINLAVSGMSCQHCAAAVRQAVTALDGVDSCDINLEAGSVAVITSGDENSVRKAVTQAIVAEGYTIS